MKYILFIAVFATMFACNKEEIGPQYVNEPLFEGQKVLILNEGSFGWGNASISAYNPDQYIVANGVFNSVNNLPLGDVCQSGIRWDAFYLIVVNNSNRIEFLDSTNLESIGHIECMGSPRYLLPAKNNLAYVSDLYSNKLGLLDLVTHQFTDSITVPGWVEKMVYANELLYGTCPNSSCVVCIDTSSNAVQTIIDVGIEAMSIVKDQNGKLWIMGSGVGGNPSRIICIDPVTNSIVVEFEFQEFEYPSQLKINGIGDELYYLNDGVCKMSITDLELPLNKFIVGYGQTNYGLAVHAHTNEIYLTDAKDFIQPGGLYRFNQYGEIVDSVTCGIIPQEVIF